MNREPSDTALKTHTAASDSELRFTAENTLGRLAKWLRILGYDTLYLSRPDPEALVRLCGGDRLLLTRTRDMAARLPADRVVLIEPDDPRQQVRQVIRQLGIGRAQVRLFSRCVRCNTAVTPIERDDIFGRVPDYVWETHRLFSICPACGRIYWPGSHLRHSLEIMETFFAP